MMRALLLACLIPGVALAGETFFTQQGRLLDSAGGVFEGNHDLAITLYSDEAGTTEVWQKTFTGIPFSQGYYSVGLEGLDDAGSPRELDGAFAGGDTWLGVSVDGSAELQPLQRVPSSVGPELPRWGFSINSSASSTHCETTSTTPVMCDEANWPEVPLASRSGNYKVTFTGNMHGGTSWVSAELFVNESQYGDGAHGNWHYGTGSSYTWNPVTIVWIVTGLPPNTEHRFNMGIRCNGGTCYIHHNSGTNSGGYGGKLLVEELG